MQGTELVTRKFWSKFLTLPPNPRHMSQVGGGGDNVDFRFEHLKTPLLPRIGTSHGGLSVALYIAYYTIYCTVYWKVIVSFNHCFMFNGKLMEIIQVEIDSSFRIEDWFSCKQG